MDNRTVARVLAGVLWIGPLVGGCAADVGRHPVRLAPMARPFVHDVPIPVGFRFAEHVSEDRLSGARRLYLRHVYVGPAANYDVRHFYSEQMPRFRWRKVADGHVKGEYQMRFEKGDEDCDISIRDRGGWRSECEVQIIITQHQRDATPPRRRARGGRQRP